MKIYCTRRKRKDIDDILHMYAGKDIWVKFQLKVHNDLLYYIKIDTPICLKNGTDTITSFYYQRVSAFALQNQLGSDMIHEERTRDFLFFEDYRLCQPVDTLTTDEVMEMLNA